MKPIIEVDNISKVFPARRGPRHLRGAFGVGEWFTGRKGNTFTALQDITLHVEPGESLGIIGRNGSGKSTLLSVIVGVTLPSSGRVVVRGRMASLLELGAGFNPVLTGRENIYLNAGLMGMRHAQVDEVFDEIVAFSGIEEFIDQPVETYSSGMYVRIGFAVAVHTNPDIFLADEVLAVGDAEFQRKCIAKIDELRDQKKTIVFVSHDLGAVNTLCDRVILLEKGRVSLSDTTQNTILHYLRQVGSGQIIKCGRLTARLEHGFILLFWDDVAITTYLHVYTSMLIAHLWNDSQSLFWSDVASTPDGMVLKGQSRRLPFGQEWEITTGDNAIHLRIWLENTGEIEIDEYQASVVLTPDYKRWETDYETGDFLEYDKERSTWVHCNKIYTPGTSIRAKSDGQPTVVMTLDDACPEMRMTAINTSYKENAHVLQALRPSEQGRICLQPGRHLYFSGTISVLPAEPDDAS